MMRAVRTIVRAVAVAVAVAVAFPVLLLVDAGTRPEAIGAWWAWHAAIARCDGDITSAGLPGLAERAAAVVCGAPSSSGVVLGGDHPGEGSPGGGAPMGEG